MAQFNLLIIDDDPSRQLELTNIFGDPRFNIKFIFQQEDFWKSVRDFPKYDCIISDVSFDKWISEGDTKELFFSLVACIGKDIPLILYSSVIKTVLNWTNRLREEGYKIIHTIALNDQNGQICSVETSQLVKNNIFYLLNTHKNYAYMHIETNDDINILHISDLQFGDPDHKQALSETFDSALAKSISDGKIPDIHLIAITGDIAYDGTPSQYAKAKEWIIKVCKSIFGNENFQNRILLVPGNHDANLSMCSLNMYTYDFPSKDDTEGIDNVRLKKRNPAIDDYSIYSIDPFRDFAYSITKDENWLNCKDLNFINSKFSYLGVNFVHINSIAPHKQLGYKDAKFEVNIDTLRQLKEKYQTLNLPSNMYSIILNHSSPKFIGFDIDKEDASWVPIAHFFMNVNAKLYIYGHRHKNLTDMDIPFEDHSSMRICGTGTLLCEPDSGDSRGFKIIKLKRKNDVIQNVEISKFRFTNEAEIKTDD